MAGASGAHDHNIAYIHNREKRLIKMPLLDRFRKAGFASFGGNRIVLRLLLDGYRRLCRIRYTQVFKLLRNHFARAQSITIALHYR